MGRKNSSARRRNIKGRMDRRQKGVPRLAKATDIPRISLDELVLPDGQCRFQSPRKPKARFATKEKAAKALEQARKTRARTGSGRVEKRYYPCPEGGCGGYHLTSREEFDEKIWRERRKLNERSPDHG